jgi:hypothetical protein
MSSGDSNLLARASRVADPYYIITSASPPPITA